MNTGQIHIPENNDRTVGFFAIISYGASRFFGKNFSSPPATSYNNVCTVPESTLIKKNHFAICSSLSKFVDHVLPLFVSRL